MKNKNYLQDLNEIQEMARKLRSVNESINFAESYDGEYDMDKIVSAVKSFANEDIENEKFKSGNGIKKIEYKE